MIRRKLRHDLVHVFHLFLCMIPLFFLSFPPLLSAEIIISEIAIQGNFPIFEKDLRRVINIRIGEEFSSEAIMAVTDRLEKIYQDEGYDSVRVEYRLEETAPDLAGIIFVIHKGQRTRIGKISFHDDRPGEKPDIKFLLGVTTGQIYKRKKFKARLKALEEYLVRLGYLRADIRFLEEIKNHVVALNVFVYRGAKLRIEIKGHRYFSREQILGTVSFFENRFFDTLEAEESVEGIKELYEDNGFLDIRVDVSWDSPDASGDRDVVFRIMEGKRTYLKGIAFEHSGYIKEKRLKRQFLSLQSYTLFRSRPFKSLTFTKDLEALEALYRSEAFPNVRISTQTEGRGRKIKKRVIIEEGARMIVRNVSIMGNQSFSYSELRRLLTLSKGTPFRPKDYQKDRRQLAVFYGNHGYPYVKISVKLEKDEDKGIVDIFYQIDEGPQASFGRLGIQRNLKTKDKVIRMATTFKSREPFSYQEILDTQERLSNLGLFRSLSVETKGMDKMAEEVDCEIEVEEMETGRVNLGAGFSSRVGYRGYMEIREDNLWGRAISGSFRADLSGLGGRSQIIEEVGRSSKYTLTFRDPLFIPKHKIEGEGSLYTATEDRREYHSRSNGLKFGIWRPYKKRLRVGLVYHIELNRLEDITIDPAEIPEKYDEHTISAIGPTIIYDSRDNFLDPHKGIYANVSLDWSESSIVGDQDFYKIMGEGRLFHPLSSRLIAALSIRAGYIGIYGRTTKVPIQERFFAGGGNTVRGFKEDSLGPIDDDTGLPLGGRLLWINNLELRYPLYKRIIGVVFFDTGNVWESREDFENISPREGAGIGIRWLTPIGPVRLDYGMALDKRPDEGRDRFYLSIGHAF